MFTFSSVFFITMNVSKIQEYSDRNNEEFSGLAIKFGRIFNSNYYIEPRNRFRVTDRIKRQNVGGRNLRLKTLSLLLFVCFLGFFTFHFCGKQNECGHLK